MYKIEILNSECEWCSNLCQAIVRINGTGYYLCNSCLDKFIFQNPFLTITDRRTQVKDNI